MPVLTHPTPRTDDLESTVRAAAERAVAHLWDRQRPDGAWTDRLSSSTVSTALAALALGRAGREEHRERIGRSLDWLRANRRADGGWSMADDDPPSSPGMTSYAIAAFHALDPENSAELIADGRRFIERNGGYDVIPGMTDSGPSSWPSAAPIIWSLVGLRDYHDQPTLPVETMLLPASLRNKVSIGLPALLALAVMQSRIGTCSAPRRAARRVAERRALAWLRSVMAENGGVEECPMLSALMYIGLNEAGVAEDVQRGSLSYLLDTQRDDGSWAIDRDLEISVTAYTMFALAEFGDLAREPRLDRTREWLLSTQWQEPFTPLGIPAAAWSWNCPSGWPDTEDTATVLSALGLLGLGRDHPAVADGLAWLRSRQNRNGSWSEWVRNSNLLNDRPCPGVTAHVVMTLRQFGDDPGRRTALGRALRYLPRAARPDGAVPDIWFRDETHGTAKVLEAYAEMGRPGHPVATSARDWLLATQRPDGGWPDHAVEVRAEGPTAEETGWSLYSLLRAGVPPWDPAVLRGVRRLVDDQDAAGTWKPSPVGLYFEDLCYHDDLIAHTYATRALGRWLRCAERTPRP